jgi:xanthine dehydrogenase molybdopterin-binding subunit B
MFVVGLGFGSYVAGVIVSAQLVNRLGPRLAGAGTFTQAVGMTIISQLWVLAMLPLVAYAAARIVDLGPWSTALVGASTGELFSVALKLISTGADIPWQLVVMHALALAAGVVLTAQGVRRGRAVAARSEDEARRAAEARKTEYEHFARAAEQAADRAAAAQPPASEPPPAKPS